MVVFSFGWHKAVNLGKCAVSPAIRQYNKVGLGVDIHMRRISATLKLTVAEWLEHGAQVLSLFDKA